MRRKPVKALIAILLTISVVLLIAYLILLRSLPDTAGTIAVTGLSGPVEIVRDADAVPHIFASTVPDAMYGLGYVHAQDRLWQMEFQRRIGHGRLSEIFGAATLREDRFLRTVGFGRAARAAWNHLPADARQQVDAYVAGVNAFIAAHHGSHLPPEFLILGFEPEPWTGPDVLAWVKMMAWDLSANYAVELLRRDIAAHVGMDRMRELLPPYPAEGLNILSRAAPSTTSKAGPADLPGARTQSSTATRAPRVDVARLFDSGDSGALARSLSPADSPLRRLLIGGGGTTEGLGSNNWVVDGSLTASGRPLLANDPHLGAQIPSLWYLAHLTAGDYDVIGATLPGTPAVAIGRNRFIAWGETNAFDDVEDLYQERLDPAGTHAEFKGALEPLRLITETIAVKGGADVRVDVRISRHGPLVSDAINANSGTATGQAGALPALAFRWTALDDDDGTIVAFLRLNAARNWTEFTSALREFVVPAQNFVYADVDGHIGYYAPGRVPIRAGGDGLLPAEGWSGAMEWTGWIPFDELPHAYDPPSHFIVTANNRPVPPDYKYTLGFEYHEPYRAQRITDLLTGKTGLTPDDFRTIQTDTFSLHARRLLPLLLNHARPDAAADRQAIDRLRRWNFDASPDSAAAAIFEAWMSRLAPQLVGDDLGPGITLTYQRQFTFIDRFIVNTLSHGASSFCGRPAAADVSIVASANACDADVTSALHDAIRMLTERLGTDMSHWRWDQAHSAVFPHQGLDTVTGFHWLLSRSVANRGDWSTVNVGAIDVTHPFEQSEVPGYRQIIDLSPANDNRFLGSVGQSGHFLSSHYDDQLQAWHDVQHLKMRMDRKQIEQHAIGRLRLIVKN